MPLIRSDLETEQGAEARMEDLEACRRAYADAETLRERHRALETMAALPGGPEALVGLQRKRGPQDRRSWPTRTPPRKIAAS